MDVTPERIRADTTPPPRRSGRLIATCGGCDRTWTGYSMAHCSRCHQTFGGVSSFDHHRSNGACKYPAELGLVFNANRNCWSDEYRGSRGPQQQ